MEALLINLLIHSYIFFTFHSWCLSPEGVNTYTNRSLTTRTYARARALGAHKRYELHEGLENTGGPATSRRWHPDLAHLGWGAGGGSRDLAPSQIQHLPPTPSHSTSYERGHNHTTISCVRTAWHPPSGSTPASPRVPRLRPRAPSPFV